MDNSNKKQNDSLEKVIFDSLTDEQKAEVAIAFVEAKQADARAKKATADKAEAEVKKTTAETANVNAEIEKTEAEVKKFTVEKIVAVAGLAITATIGVGKLLVPCLITKRNQEHHDREMMKYSDNEREIENQTERGLLSWIFK